MFLTSSRLRENFSTSQTIRKSVCQSSGDIVVTQHRGAAEAGARVLAQGGNAIDVAIATSFAIGVVEPWMSYPFYFACPSAVSRTSGVNFGISETMPPWGGAISQDRF